MQLHRLQVHIMSLQMLHASGIDGAAMTAPAEDDALVDAWRELLDRHARVARRARARAQDAHDLGVSEYEVLERLAGERRRQRRMQELGEALHLSQSALSRVVGRLEQRRARTARHVPGGPARHLRLHRRRPGASATRRRGPPSARARGGARLTMTDRVLDQQSPRPRGRAVRAPRDGSAGAAARAPSARATTVTGVPSRSIRVGGSRLSQCDTRSGSVETITSS